MTFPAGSPADAPQARTRLSNDTPLAWAIQKLVHVHKQVDRLFQPYGHVHTYQDHPGPARDRLEGYLESALRVLAGPEFVEALVETGKTRWDLVTVGGDCYIFRIDGGVQ